MTENRFVTGIDAVHRHAEDYFATMDGILLAGNENQRKVKKVYPILSPL
ncbi:MAG: hypothetical protein PHE27_03240 [Alphaproteobacteria bacterium]|nr:hypothetical protein [Alphaproteobacteria bacterium]